MSLKLIPIVWLMLPQFLSIKCCYHTAHCWWNHHFQLTKLSEPIATKQIPHVWYTRKPKKLKKIAANYDRSNSILKRYPKRLQNRHFHWGFKWKYSSVTDLQIIGYWKVKPRQNWKNLKGSCIINCQVSHIYKVWAWFVRFF